MKLKLISHTANIEEVVSMAAKLCYSPVGVDEIQEDLTPEKVEKFLNMLISIGHESPLEHASFTFAVEGISRACSHQIVRHRIASYSQQSQRYVKLDQFEYIVPPSIEAIPEAKELYIKAMEQDQKIYDDLVDLLITEQIKNSEYWDEYVSYEKMAKEQNQVTDPISYMLGCYKSEYRKYEKKAIEDARYVFPNACETKLVFTMNTRTLYNFLHHRCCERAQWEIREVAIAMLKELKKVAPILFKNSGPNCVSGGCPEGKMTCGKIVEIREKFKNL